MMNFETFLLTIAFVICGLPSFIINILVFSVIIKHRTFRRYYTIIAFVILNNGLTGLNDVILGIIRLIDISNSREDQLIDRRQCFLHPSNFLAFLVFLNGLGLLASSLDRLLVIKYPTLYFRNMKLITSILLAAIYIIPIFLITVATLIEINLSTRLISPLCFEQLIYVENTYSVILCVRTLAAATSIPIMITVVIIMYERREEIIARNEKTSFANINAFIERQKNYTKTSIWSCLITFFLYVLPAVNQLVHDRLDTYNENEMALYALLLDNINSYNIVLIFLFRQKDIFKQFSTLFTFSNSRKQTVISISRKENPTKFGIFGRRKTGCESRTKMF